LILRDEPDYGEQSAILLSIYEWWYSV